MTITILSAAYANAEQSAVMLKTVEMGDVLASATGTPDLWPLLDLSSVTAYAFPAGLAQAQLTKLIQRHMDRQAWALGYDDLKTAITYRGDPNPKFAAEAQVFFEWRSAVWTKAYEVLAQVQAGEVAMPTATEALALLPPLVLPQPVLPASQEN